MSDAHTVLATLPPALKKAFEDSDEVAMKAALSQLPAKEKAVHWDNIVKSGLWAPNKQWKIPLARRPSATGSTVELVAQKEFATKEILATFAAGPLGLGLSDAPTGGAIVSSTEDSSAAHKNGIPSGARVLSVNGTSTQGMNKRELIAVIKAASVPKTLKFAPPKSSGSSGRLVADAPAAAPSATVLPAVSETIPTPPPAAPPAGPLALKPTALPAPKLAPPPAKTTEAAKPTVAPTPKPAPPTARGSFPVMLILAILVGVVALLASDATGHADALAASVTTLVSPPVVHRCVKKGKKGCKPTERGVKCQWHPEGLGECREV